MRFVVLAVGAAAKAAAVASDVDEEKNQQSLKRTLLRMEASYIGCFLAGICVAGILVDVTNGMAERVVPGILQLVASLAAFGLILQCFPEDQCSNEQGQPQRHDTITICKVATTGLVPAARHSRPVSLLQIV